MKASTFLSACLIIPALILAAADGTRASTGDNGTESATTDIDNVEWQSLPVFSGALPHQPPPDTAALEPSPPAAPNDAPQSESIEWMPLIRDSLRFLLFENAFRFTQERTRAGLSGPFFQDYADSVLNIHGWNDGDPFKTNYIGHPMQGAISGFLEVSHDPRYRTAEFGRSSTYWKSRLRATGFAAAYSLQFEIGPISEASLGNVQQNPRATGVVDWVITPTMGFAWMVGEDAIDAKVIRRLETRTDSRAARIFLRGALNPCRSFTNMLQFKPPWHRDTRPGITEF